MQILAFTCDDVSPKTEASTLNRVLTIADRYNVRGTFFVIPEARDGARFRGPLSNMVKDACGCGHEVGLHGLHHTPLEVGIDIGSLSLDRASIRDRIVSGMRILESDLGIRPLGFRAPYHQHCRALLRILDDLEFLYDSSEIAPFALLFSYFLPLRLVSTLLGWEIPIATIIKPYHPMKSNLLEIPVVKEYTGHTLKFEIEPLVEALKREICQSEMGVFVLNSHIGGLSLAGLEILRQFFFWVENTGLESLTLEEVARRACR